METQLTYKNTKEIDRLNTEAWQLNRKNPTKAIDLAREALRHSLEIGYGEGVALAKKTLGACHVWLSRNEEAANYCFESISLFHSLHDLVNEAEATYLLGVNFFYLSDYDTAIKYYKRCYDLNVVKGSEVGMADALNGMGSVYYTIEQNDKALEVLLESQILCKKNNAREILMKVQDGLGETFYNLGEYEKALSYYNNCIELILELDGSPQVHAFALDGLGRTYAGLRQFDKAMLCYEQSLKIRLEMDFKFGVTATLANIGKLYALKSNTEKAIKHLTDAFKMATKIGNKEGIYQSSEKLSELYSAQQNYEEAYKYYRSFHLAKEEVRTHKSEQLSKSLELQNKMLQSQAERAILEERAKELENFSESLELMRDVGQKIISNLSVANIVTTVYQSVNELMEAPGFGIGLYNKGKNIITYPLYIEGNERFENLVYDLEDETRLTAICFNQAREIVINDFENEIGNYVVKRSPPKAGATVTSLIYLPLVHNKQVLGVMTVQSFNKNAYTNYQLNIFRNLASYTAIALLNARMYEEQELMVKERTKELVQSKEQIERTYRANKKLSEIGKQITASLNIGKIFKKLYESVNEIMAAECFGVRIYRPEINAVEYKFEIENGKMETPVFVPLSDDDNYTVWCIKNKKDIFLNDNVNEYHKYVNQIRVVQGEMPASLLFTPMMLGEKLVGVITVQSFKKFAYQPFHLEILKTLSTYTAIALENAYLYEYMEEKVKERTIDVVNKKEEIERTYENTRLVSMIGKEISTTFSIEEIISKVYNSVNKLMDAAIFGIGIYDPRKNEIVFTGVIENGVRLDDYSYSLTKVERPAILCFTSQNDYVINNFSEEFIAGNKISNYKVLQGAAPESIIYVPVTQNNKKIGVMTVQSFKPNAYTDYHLQLIKSLSTYTAIAIDNASLYNNLELMVKDRTREISTAYENTRLLSHIAEDISSSLSVETISSKLYENVNKLMDATMFGIGLYNPRNNALEFKGFVENNQLMNDFSYPADDPDRLAAYCFGNEMTILINDYSKEYQKYVSGIKAPVSGRDATSIVYIPLYAKGNIIGVFTVQSFERNAYSDYHFNILKNLGVSIGIAMENANLYSNLEEKVRERTSEVIKQKAIIEEKNKDITDSIRYAKKIQQAISPPMEEFNRNFSDSFVLYRPKDIVSGDFYWIENFNSGVTLFAAADCTGHGVPGAFMSLICRDIMDKIIKDQNVTSTSQALHLIDQKLVQLIKKTSESSANDGMDIALCAYYKKEGFLQYSGAYRPLLIVRNNEILEFKPNKYSIGGHTTEGKQFDLNKIDVYPGDQIYLLTDGFADQFGGEKGKKFKYKNLKSLILKVSGEPMAIQRKLIDEAFMNWKGSLEQVDDVCIMGMRV